MLNSVQIIGRLGADPDTRVTGSGKNVCRMRIATNHGHGDKEVTEWHTVVSFDKLAESCSSNLKKGRLVFVEGRLSTSSWEKDGVKHARTEILANTVKFLDRPPEGTGRPITGTGPDEDIPF